MANVLLSIILILIMGVNFIAIQDMEKLWAHSTEPHERLLVKIRKSVPHVEGNPVLVILSVDTFRLSFLENMLQAYYKNDKLKVVIGDGLTDVPNLNAKSRDTASKPTYYVFATSGIEGKFHNVSDLFREAMEAEQHYAKSVEEEERKIYYDQYVKVASDLNRIIMNLALNKVLNK